MTENKDQRPLDFIRQIIEKDLASGKHTHVVTRFPPEPNGYLHIGHAKAICLNFGLAEEYSDSLCHLRFDDTNPVTEKLSFAHAIEEDVRWLGFHWEPPTRYASSYFEELYNYAEQLIHQGDAYVCELSPQEIREYRGTLTAPGRNSPWRDRPIAENLQLFGAMAKGESDENRYVLRARIDMSSANLNMRDPVIYRVLKVPHHRTGERWNCYPTYDFAHCLSDAIEGITHSLCTLEFEDHRPLYDWFLQRLHIPHPPRQIEFARLNLAYTVTSKRILKRLVSQDKVSGWDDPRLPTLAGIRRRGYPPEAIHDFCRRIGIAKADNLVDMAMLEYCVRTYLDYHAPRAMCVRKPLKVVLQNYPKEKEETLYLANHPKREELGKRPLTFANELYIEQGDFSEMPPKGFKRLIPGGIVRLRGAYVIRCDEVVKHADGTLNYLLCSYMPDTLNKNPTVGNKPKGVIQWLSVNSTVEAKLHMYERLLTHPEVPPETEVEDALNPDSLTIIDDVVVESSLAEASPEGRWQFERIGYFCVDVPQVASNENKHSSDLVFNCIVSLRENKPPKVS